tara:strand:+ start:964 stop:1308 length:345 start_codon:yes stop_codon:yes gene_type:complete
MAVRAVLTRSFAALTVALVAAFFVHSAQAQMIACFQGDALEIFERKHNEKLLVMGVSENKMLVRFLGNKETGTWTIILTPPNGSKTYCIADSGKYLQVVEPPKSGDKILWGKKQ